MIATLTLLLWLNFSFIFGVFISAIRSHTHAGLQCWHPTQLGVTFFSNGTHGATDIIKFCYYDYKDPKQPNCYEDALHMWTDLGIKFAFLHWKAGPFTVIPESP